MFTAILIFGIKFSRTSILHVYCLAIFKLLSFSFASDFNDEIYIFQKTPKKIMTPTYYRCLKSMLFLIFLTSRCRYNQNYLLNYTIENQSSKMLCCYCKNLWKHKNSIAHFLCREWLSLRYENRQTSSYHQLSLKIQYLKPIHLS